MALFYIAHIYLFLAKKFEDRVLLSSFFAIASFMVTITIPILISREWLAVSWAVQAVTVLWVAQKLDSRFLEKVAGILYLIVFCMFFADLGHHFLPITAAHGEGNFWIELLQRLLTFGVMIGSFFSGAWLLNHRQKYIESLRVQDSSNGLMIPTDSLSIALNAACIGLGFLYLNIEFFKTFNYLDEMLTNPAMTTLWVGLAMLLLVVYRRNKSDNVMTVLSLVIAAIFLKLIFVDMMMGWEITEHLSYAVCDTKGAIIRLFDFGIIIGMLVTCAYFLRDSEKELAHKQSVAAIVGAVGLLFAYTSLELNSTLYHFLPDSRMGGISILWSLYALAFIAIGIGKNIRTVRYVGLALFAVVTLKVFFVDLANVDRTTRIVAFIILGVILMGGSLLYMRCRQLFDTREDQS